MVQHGQLAWKIWGWYKLALNFNKVEIMNGIDAHLNMTSDMTIAYTNVIPTWEMYTILDASFNGNLNGGNLNFTLSQLDTILVKRREVGTQTWITVFSIPIVTSLDLSFIKIDRWCGLGTYEYALVPSLNGTEGQYTIVEVESLFHGIFLCDANNTFRFLGNADYGSVEQQTEVGVFKPFGKKYATVVSNAEIDYKQLSLSGLLLPNEFYTTGQIDADANRELVDNFTNVLAQRKPKILKDQAGHIWMVQVAGNKSINYESRMGMRLANVSVPLVEIGSVVSQSDLNTYGFVSQ